jgi:hypothetical protein
MIVTSDMTVKEVLNINEHMLEAFVWLARSLSGCAIRLYER